MYETPSAFWWICVVGITAKDNPKNNTLHKATAYLSGHTIFIQMRVNSLAPSKKKSWYCNKQGCHIGYKKKKIRKKAQQR